MGIRTSAYHLILAVITSVIIVLAMNLVGSLLISALIVFPALSAMRICRSFRATVICSAALGVTGAILGILISLLASTPVGPTIVVMELAIFLIAGLFGTKK
jgi:zinc transport system permease protein